MYQIGIIFGTRLGVDAGCRALPWGMPHFVAAELTPKTHDISWYTSGFI